MRSLLTALVVSSLLVGAGGCSASKDDALSVNDEDLVASDVSAAACLPLLEAAEADDAGPEEAEAARACVAGINDQNEARLGPRYEAYAGIGEAAYGTYRAAADSVCIKHSKEDAAVLALCAARLELVLADLYQQHGRPGAPRQSARTAEAPEACRTAYEAAPRATPSDRVEGVSALASCVSEHRRERLKRLSKDMKERMEFLVSAADDVCQAYDLATRRRSDIGRARCFADAVIGMNPILTAMR